MTVVPTTEDTVYVTVSCEGVTGVYTGISTKYVK